MYNKEDKAVETKKIKLKKKNTGFYTVVNTSIHINSSRFHLQKIYNHFQFVLSEYYCDTSSTLYSLSR